MSEDITEIAARRNRLRKRHSIKSPIPDYELGFKKVPPIRRNQSPLLDSPGRPEDPPRHDPPRGKATMEPPLPYVLCKCQNYSLYALINSACARSFIRRTALAKFGSQSTDEQVLPWLVGNATKVADKNRRLEIQLGEKILGVDVIVVESGPEFCIGADILNTYKCVLNFQTGTLTVGRQRVNLLTEEQIPPDKQ
ncbi:uncharacterized protein LOC106176686 [Lingula anatina]|uniref:Uncharacterized protein LOC106176686 n=1 Tax=Lingula anatina TaxID=7574 RepID=A0A1S3JWE4_LINAN|nr:uncharacterized protein LOC106176686 [Lingula anatina]XP_013414623.1 uncharacterized protein LOC106176686 [Lingula anatina]XP_013414624.1 uncharacterized protein LOC106176686 [Lingula anatina]|eukprot:XP_013414622.1 uncharacterized protein LOC106176686 [Lingula anatina]